MYEFETNIDFMGEPRPCLVSWDEVDKECVVRAVEVAHLIRQNYLPSGRFAPHFERISMDVKALLSDEQIWGFVEEIRTASRKGKAADFSASELLRHEEQQERFRKAA